MFSCAILFYRVLISCHYFWYYENILYENASEFKILNVAEEGWFG